MWAEVLACRSPLKTRLRLPVKAPLPDLPQALPRGPTSLPLNRLARPNCTVKLAASREERCFCSRAPPQIETVPAGLGVVRRTSIYEYGRDRAGGACVCVARAPLYLFEEVIDGLNLHSHSCWRQHAIRNPHSPQPPRRCPPRAST
jgi:hypothetical protein